MNSFLDRLTEIYTDYGGALVRRNNIDRKPEVVSWHSIAFCDQTDILSAPIGFRHYFSIDKLRAQKWWKNEVETVIEKAIAENSKKKTAENGQMVESSGVQIEVFEVHGEMPDAYMKDEPEDNDWKTYTRQMQIVAFYRDAEDQDKRKGITLYRQYVHKEMFKMVVRDETGVTRCS